MINKKNLINQIKKSNFPEFYKKVWLQCIKIPAGKVKTYKWIAKKIGLPNAYRAVGIALSKNPFAPDVPCHRVIRSDGKLGGYSGGIHKKIKLLTKEFKKKCFFRV